MTQVRVLIVDDEPLSRRGLRQLLDVEPGVEVIAECRDASTASAYEGRVDVIFLDVEMPGVSGVAFARGLQGQSRPAVVFVTAHERYAVPAFDIPALDFLTKPVDPVRLSRALDRVRANRPLASPSHLVTRVGARDLLVPVSDVVAIEADGVYAAVHAGRRFLVRRSLTELEAELGGEFLRVHRSWLVRRSAVREVRGTRVGGSRELVLESGLLVPVSRRRSAGLVDRVVSQPSR